MVDSFLVDVGGIDVALAALWTEFGFPTLVAHLARFIIKIKSSIKIYPDL